MINLAPFLYNYCTFDNKPKIIIDKYKELEKHKISYKKFLYDNILFHSSVSNIILKMKRNYQNNY